MSVVAKDQLNHLQHLSAVRFSDDEVQDFQEKLDSVIGYLGQLQDLDCDDAPAVSHPSLDHSCPISDEIGVYPDAPSLFQNVKHEMIAQSIVIKSVHS